MREKVIRDTHDCPLLDKINEWCNLDGWIKCKPYQDTVPINCPLRAERLCLICGSLEVNNEQNTCYR